MPYISEVYCDDKIQSEESSQKGDEENYGQNSKAEIITSFTTIKPGDSFWVAIKISLNPGWHTYWINPGDAGLPPQVNWVLPKNFKVSSLIFMAPKRLVNNGLVSFGYENETYLLAQITAPASNNAEKISIKAKLNWLICKDSCIPQETNLHFDLNVDPKASQRNPEGTVIDQLLKELPSHPKEHCSFSITDSNVVLTVPKSILLDPKGKAPVPIGSITFFPTIGNFIDYSVLPTIEDKGASLVLTLQRSQRKNAKLPQELSGVIQEKEVGSDITKSVRVDFDLSTVNLNHETTDIKAGTKNTTYNLLLIVFFALLGGLILNVMPCVFPVLALKALSAVQESAHHRSHYTRQGGYYFTYGVLISFLILASLLLMLRTAGSYVGWGFQMQNPYFVSGIILILYFLALSLSGEIYLPVLFGDFQASLTMENKSHKWSNFWVGVLAVMVATPCTAPFMGVAIGYALTQSPISVLIIFFFLGFGFALPYLLLSLFPSVSRIFPKPGAWMETFKELMAFPIYFSVLWLLWVLVQQEGSKALILSATSIILVKFSVWLWKKVSNNQIFEKTISRYLLILTLGFVSLFPLSMLSNDQNHQVSLEANEQVFSSQALESVRKQKKPLLVYVTADWCITCKVNELALHSKTSELLYEKLGITIMKADWTNRNEEITKYLEKFGYAGVPVYVYYPPEKEPIVLPQLLTQSILSDVLIKNSK